MSKAPVIHLVVAVQEDRQGIERTAAFRHKAYWVISSSQSHGISFAGCSST